MKVNFAEIDQVEIRTFLLMIFSKNHFFVNYSVEELGFKLLFAEKLVKLSRMIKRGGIPKNRNLG